MNDMNDLEELKNESKDVNIEKLIKGFKEFESEKNRQIKICENMIEEYKFKINQAKVDIDSEHRRCVDLISSQLQAEEMKQTKTQLSYQVPAGKFIIKKPSKKLVLMDDYKTDNVSEEYIIKKEVIAINWKEYKKIIVIEDGKAINKETGEILNDVIVEDVPSKMIIKGE